VNRKDFFSRDTLKITFPIGETILAAVLLLPVLLLAIEGLIRIIPIPETLLIPTIDREINYPEIDIKYSRLKEAERRERINCFFFGTSMVDFGLNPSIFNSRSKLVGIENPSCFNMGLESMMPETSSELAEILKKHYNPAVIIVGVSPIDFAGSKYETRNFINSPWFRYQAGQFSPEGWWIANFESPGYWLSFLKYRNPDYRDQIANMNSLIDPDGFQIRENDHISIKVLEKVKYPEFAIGKPDLPGFVRFLDLNSTKTQIIVVEMPVHPDFLPYYVQGGEDGYEKFFIQPLESIVNQKGIPFIRSQPEISGMVSPDGWVDYAHLNDKGAGEFSLWLVNKLVDLNNQ
jgi:hypothetical protein